MLKSAVEHWEKNKNYLEKNFSLYDSNNYAVFAKFVLDHIFCDWTYSNVQVLTRGDYGDVVFTIYDGYENIYMSYLSYGSCSCQEALDSALFSPIYKVDDLMTIALYFIQNMFNPLSNEQA